MEQTPRLLVRDLRKEFITPADTIHVLDGVNLTANAGEVLAITGPSGSGKTTLLSIIGGLEAPTSGEIQVDGQAVATLEGAALQQYRAQTIGFIFQEHRLLPQLSAIENVLVPTLASGCRQNQPRGEELLGRVGVAHRAGSFAWQMSGGERQRVAVARALVNGAKLLLCDEPTGNLDRENSSAIVQLLLEIAHQQGVCVLLVTHNEELAARCDHRCHLVGGKVA